MEMSDPSQTTENQPIQNLEMMRAWALKHAPDLVAILDEAIVREKAHEIPN